MRKDNFVEKLPLFVASVYPCNEWYHTDVYSKSYDGKGKHLRDLEFMKQCMLYTGLAPKNKCRSLLGSDGRFYRNELCFHTEDTLLSIKLKELIESGVKLTKEEENIIHYWSEVLRNARQTEEYERIMENPNVRLGLWQIMEEINIKVPTGIILRSGRPEMRYKYILLNTAINSLDYVLKEYYKNNIIPNLFRYELVK